MRSQTDEVHQHISTRTRGPLVGYRPVCATATSLARAHALATQPYSHAQPHGCSHHVPWPLCMRVPALVALPMAPEAPPVLCGRSAAARACPCGVFPPLGPSATSLAPFPRMDCSLSRDLRHDVKTITQSERKIPPQGQTYSSRVASTHTHTQTGHRRLVCGLQR